MCGHEPKKLRYLGYRQHWDGIWYHWYLCTGCMIVLNYRRRLRGIMPW